MKAMVLSCWAVKVALFVMEAMELMSESAVMVESLVIEQMERIVVETELIEAMVDSL